jgi:hypothetical protein
MTTTTNDTKAALDAAERELRDLQAEEANGATVLRKAALSGDMAAVRGQQARQAIVPVLLAAAHEHVLRARLDHGMTERAAAEAKLGTAREESQRAGDALREVEAALLAAQQACYGPGLWFADAERRIELLGDQRRATVRDLAALLGREVGDDGELGDVAGEDDAA